MRLTADYILQKKYQLTLMHSNKIETEKKKVQNDQSISDMWDNIKHSNITCNLIPKRESK